MTFKHFRFETMIFGRAPVSGDSHPTKQVNTLKPLVTSSSSILPRVISSKPADPLIDLSLGADPLIDLSLGAPAAPYDSFTALIAGSIPATLTANQNAQAAGIVSGANEPNTPFSFGAPERVPTTQAAGIVSGANEPNNPFSFGAPGRVPTAQAADLIQFDEQTGSRSQNVRESRRVREMRALQEKLQMEEKNQEEIKAAKAAAAAKAAEAAAAAKAAEAAAAQEAVDKAAPNANAAAAGFVPPAPPPPGSGKDVVKGPAWDKLQAEKARKAKEAEAAQKEEEDRKAQEAQKKREEKVGQGDPLGLRKELERKLAMMRGENAGDGEQSTLAAVPPRGRSVTPRSGAGHQPRARSLRRSTSADRARRAAAAENGDGCSPDDWN